jgi:DNA-binding LytR/AlgR family response regulator
MINVVIIDDEPLAREGLANYVREVDFINLSGTCENPLELLPLLDRQAADLVFLDIQMPKMNGIEFLKILQKAAAKARDYYKLLTGDPIKQVEDYFFIKCGGKYEKICFDDILYVEGMQNYVTIYSAKGKYVTMLR